MVSLYSGPAEKPVAAEFVMAGTTAIAVGTAVFDHEAAAKVIAGIAALMSRNGIEDIQDNYDKV